MIDGWWRKQWLMDVSWSRGMMDGGESKLLMDDGWSEWLMDGYLSCCRGWCPASPSPWCWRTRTGQMFRCRRRNPSFSGTRLGHLREVAVRLKLKKVWHLVSAAKYCIICFYAGYRYGRLCFGSLFTYIYFARLSWYLLASTYLLFFREKHIITKSWKIVYTYTEDVQIISTFCGSLMIRTYWIYEN